eukprot:m.222365 g.222365  ORF g.222365 m.222365 type:complete len:87 (+) comp39975_c3_seq15:462-722(+)
MSFETAFGRAMNESLTLDLCEDLMQGHCPLQPNQNFTHYDYATHEQVMESAQLVRKADATLKLKSSDGAILVCITLSVNFENLVYV